MLYKIYQLVVCLPLLGLSTLLTALLTIVGCTLGKASFWAYWPPCIWSRLMCRIPLLPVEIVGRETPYFVGCKLKKAAPKQAEKVGVGSVIPRSVPANLAVKPERK